MSQDNFADIIPYGDLGIIALESSRAIGEKVDNYVSSWRNESRNDEESIHFTSYKKDSYLIDAVCPRFGSGESKGLLNESVRGKDLYILLDVCNHSLTYKVCGQVNHMSPDDHYQDLKRIIAAVSGKARRITVIMPFLYEGRQHKRSTRESLDCALALQELTNMGVESIITFDAHDPRVQNAIPLNTFETIQPTYQFIKAMLKNVPDIQMNPKNLMIISPDEGATGRAIYFADVATELKRRKANRIFVAATFGLFTNGLEKFDKAFESGLIYRVMTTNLVYQPEELLSKEYYINVDMSKYIALLINTLNHDSSIANLLDPSERIQKILKKYGQQ